MSSVRAIFLLLEVEIDDTAQTRQFALPRAAISSKMSKLQTRHCNAGLKSADAQAAKTKVVFFQKYPDIGTAMII
jgi:hypothetical protein